MKVELIALCDYAAVMGGKLVITGVIDRINVPEVPALSPRSLMVAVKFRHDLADRGKLKRKVDLYIRDPDDQAILTVNGLLKASGEIALPDDLVDYASASLAIPLPPMELKGHGRYRVELSVDGDKLGEIPLFVVDPQKIPRDVTPPGPAPGAT